MLLILDTHVEVKLSSRNRSWYKQKGYIYEENQQYIIVKIEDLFPSSRVKVNVACDFCGEKFKKEFRYVYNKVACHKCKGKLYSEINERKNIEHNLNNIEIDENTCYLKIDKKTTAIFDYEDLNLVIKHKWFEDEAGYIRAYIKCSDGKIRQIGMHQ